MFIKQRFGESPLHFCEVMLKDVGDSKRINNLLISSVEVSLTTYVTLSTNFYY